jgi:hypothetical protein
MSTAPTVSRLAMGQASLLGASAAVAAPERAAGDPTGDPGRELKSLDDLIVDTWEELVRGASQCPVCGGRMEPQYGTDARPVAGRCADCGSALH